MNQEKIGKFISTLRKEKKLTQSELATILGVTDRSISNWENGKCMPDLSLFKPLCNELGITINELLSGEKIEEEKYQEKFEENIVKTIDYTNKKIIEKNNFLGIILLTFGIIIILTAISIFPSDSSWGSIYSIIGAIITLIGFYKLIVKVNFEKRVILSILFFIVVIISLFLLDFANVFINNTSPRFAYYKETVEDAILYKAPFYQVFRINRDTKNEYYIVDIKNKYTLDNVPKVPFNKNKSGIGNIVKYKSKYVGDNSNTGAIVNSLPLSEYGFALEIDSKNYGITIDYNVTDWYINENLYLQKSLLYNSISIFSLIENVEYIKYNFSGNDYIVYKDKLEKEYPNYKDIKQNNIINENNFNKYVEKQIDNNDFVEDICKRVFE